MSEYKVSKDATTQNAAQSKAVPLLAMWRLGGEEVQLLLIHDLGTRWA